MSLFTTDWRKAVGNLLPPRKRSGSIIDNIYSLVIGLNTDMVANQFFNDDIRKRALFNGRKMVLQGALNYIFGVSSPPYIIVETQHSPVVQLYIFNESEGINRYVFNESETESTTFIFNEGELPDAYNILIKIPVGIYTAELERRVRSEVINYKLSGKSFNVITY